MEEVDAGKLLDRGSTEFSAANSQPVARARPTSSCGSSASLFSATWSAIAPLSKRTSPSSAIAGACPKGWRARCSGDRCSGPSATRAHPIGQARLLERPADAERPHQGAAKSGTQS